MNDLLLRALRCEKVPRPPVWLMRQAGRYMPQYQLFKRQHSLNELFHCPSLATEITCLPIDALGVDAAILFSDILVIVEALGLTLTFPERGGPTVTPLLKKEEDVKGIIACNVPSTFEYVFETIRRVKARVEVPLIGFCGGPFTVATYCAENAQGWLQQDPDGFALLLDKITEVSIDYLQCQIKAGVDVIQVFDSWANRLTDVEFSRFCLPYLQRLVHACHGTPVILFCRDSSRRVDLLSAIQPAAISCDWHVPMADLRAKVPSHIALQGNFSPELLHTPLEQIQIEVETMLHSLRNAPGIIVNLGHGVLPDTPFHHVQHFVQAVKEFFLSADANRNQ